MDIIQDQAETIVEAVLELLWINKKYTISIC